jgi:hypothetical protein
MRPVADARLCRCIARQDWGDVSSMGPTSRVAGGTLDLGAVIGTVVVLGTLLAVGAYLVGRSCTALVSSALSGLADLPLVGRYQERDFPRRSGLEH